MPPYTLPFEKPIAELQDKLSELHKFSEQQDIDVSDEVRRMEVSIRELRRRIYSDLTPWQKVQVARHPMRPYTRDYIGAMTEGFIELHGDRRYADDAAIVGGFCRIDGRRVLLLGTQKGRDTKSNLACNFGCAFPEGYRKALRLMQLAGRFGVPIVSLIDTPGAFPGVESEERHIAEAIAVNLREMFRLPVPVVVCIIGEGGSGGALGIGVGDRVLMLEHAYYSVISPEGCAAILWKDRAYADRAAAALKLTAKDLLQAGLADEVVPEPEGGAHTNIEEMTGRLRDALVRNLDELTGLPPAELMEKRYTKFRSMGVFEEETAPEPCAEIAPETEAASDPGGETTPGAPLA